MMGMEVKRKDIPRKAKGFSTRFELVIAHTCPHCDKKFVKTRALLRHITKCKER